MYLNRLITLYRMLDGIPDERVNLRYWRYDQDESDKHLLHGCGSMACVIGWACAYPPFKALGLRYVEAGCCGHPEFHDEYGMAAAARFFDIREVQATHLFTAGESIYDPPTWDNDKERALHRIREFLREQGALK